MSQYYGWALVNRAALMPSLAQLETANALVEQARETLRGRVTIDYVVPDYYAARPKACMGGWARQTINVTPSGKALPCHAAETLPGFAFPSVGSRASPRSGATTRRSTRFRGTAWMPEPCRSCDRRELDWGGCRCQAFALTGDPAATDPACVLAPDHALMAKAVAAASGPMPDFVYRRIGAPVLAS